MKAYRVITDEPMGICVGFKPEKWVTDEFDVVSDDGGSNVFITGGLITISSKSTLHWRDFYQEPDLVVWRTPEQFAQWEEEMGTP